MHVLKLYHDIQKLVATAATMTTINALISTMTNEILMTSHCTVRSIMEDIGDMVRVIKTTSDPLRELT